MRWPFLIVLAAFLAAPAAAENRAVFLGTWGTAEQCARAPIKPGGTVLSEPFVISADWLKQGQQWCRLRWGPVESRQDGFFTAANALCGEDTARGYFLGMILSGESLTLRWDVAVWNGPLQRCPDP